MSFLTEVTHFQRLHRCLHLRSTRRGRNRWIHACGVEPSLHRDRLISGSKPHRHPAFQQRERAQTHLEVLPRRQRVSVKTDVHAIVEILVLRSRAVSASSLVAKTGNDTPHAKSHPRVVRRRVLPPRKGLHHALHRASLPSFSALSSLLVTTRFTREPQRSDSFAGLTELRGIKRTDLTM